MLQELAATPRKRLQRRHLLLILIAGVGLGIATFFWPKDRSVAMRLVGCYPLECPGLTVTEITTDQDLILCWEARSKAACFRCDGTLLWKVNIPQQHLVARYTVSSDGHIFAVALRQSKQYSIYTWRDGRLLGITQIPSDARLQSLRALASGRVFIHAGEKSTLRVTLVDGEKVIAHGSMTIPLGLSDSYLHSTDGKVFASVANLNTFTYYTVNISGENIIFKPQYTATESWPRLYNNLLVTQNGAIYNEHGQISPPNGWDIVSTFICPISKKSSADIPPGEAIIQCQKNSDNLRLLYDKIRVYSPITGDSWAPQQRKRRYATVTPDGQYLLADESPATEIAHAKLHDSFGQNHIFDDLDSKFENQPMRLVLYKRPGVRCAYVPLVASQPEWVAEEKYNVYGIRLSPDGKHVYLLGYEMSRAPHYYVLHYTW